MNLAFMLLMAVVSAPNDAAAEQQRFLALHHEWQRMHRSAAKAQIPARAFLLVDPREKAVWIEKDGKVDARDILPLPAGFEWFAYHLTPRGLTQISFPVRLNHPRPDLQNDEDSESIIILGMGKDRSWRCTISASQSRRFFHVGSGSRISSMTFTMPALKAALLRDPLRDSMLVSNSPHAKKWADTIRNRWLSITVKRIATAP